MNRVYELAQGFVENGHMSSPSTAAMALAELLPGLACPSERMRAWIALRIL
ncbi:hypothetical protein [Actinoplanes sp. NPDC026619]|uniref:hypothetical protein n=1 Tax=Actinoplanes sp. NPDC026619 TaxID=3155798 RepID=UPI0033D4F92C